MTFTGSTCGPRSGGLGITDLVVHILDESRFLRPTTYVQHINLQLIIFTYFFRCTCMGMRHLDVCTSGHLMTARHCPPSSSLTTTSTTTRRNNSGNMQSQVIIARHIQILKFKVSILFNVLGPVLG